MKREIKFKAYNEKNSNAKERMVYGVTLSPDGLVCMPDGDWWLLPLMQFTGLKDKNGKEIYEGDIVCTSYGKHKKVECSGLSDNPNYFHKVVKYEYNEFEPFDVTGEYGRKEANCEVIGNIFENKELLSK